jgi:hypothetical protein
MKTQKRIFRGLLLSLGLVGLLSSFLSIVLNNQAYADTIPSPDGQNHLLVHVSDSKTNYQVTATNSQKTFSLPYNAREKGYYSGGLNSSGVTGGDCINSATRGIQSFTISVRLNGKPVGNDPFNFCGKGLPFIQTTTIAVSAPRDPTSISGCITYKDDQDKTQKFKSEASGKIDGPNGKSYNLKFDDNGCITTIPDPPPGNYKITADYLPSNLPDQHYEKAFTLKAGEDFKFTGLAGAAGTSTPADKPTSGAESACKKYAPGEAEESPSVYSACLDAYKDSADGKSQKEACDDKYPAGSKRLEGCLVGFKAGTTTDDDDTSACIANSSTTLEWIGCPIITALSKGADKLNGLVEDQLNFKTSRFLPEDGDNNGAYKAWAIIKNLSTSILIIILLIMVFSQAVGSGFFEAYTIRKVLPRLVAAVIGMQLSWELCILIINLINGIGEGLAQLITAPFGGRSNLDLPSLLNHLNGLVAAGTSVTLVAVLVSSVFLSAIFLPGALLIAFSVLVTVLIGLASILFRNIIIIVCVIFAPIALLMWVIPNSSTKKYWSLWSDNFSKVLLLFPIMVGIIYSGRIFAWIAGDLGATAGFLDLIMVLVGFFAPYAILPKAFKWGGSLMSSGANAIATNGITKKSREVGNRELRGHLERKQGEVASNYNPEGPMLGMRRSKLGIGRYKLPVPTGRLATRIQAGSLMPTERGRRLVIQKGDKWAGERNDEASAYIKSVGENARVGGFKDPKTGEFAKDANGNIVKGVSAMKLAYNEIAGNAYKTDADKRAARQAVHQMMETSSWIEFQEKPIQGGPNAGKRVVDLPVWRDQLNKVPGDYSGTLGPRPDLAPDVIESAQEHVATRRGKLISQLTDADQPAIDKERLEISIGRLKAGDVSRLHFGFFQDIAKLNDPKVSTDFARRLQEFQTEGGQLGAQAVASLLGGSESRANEALALSTIPGTKNVKEIIHSAGSGSAPATGTTAPAGTAPAAPAATPAAAGNAAPAAAPAAPATGANAPAAPATGANTPNTASGNTAATTGVPSGLNKEQTTQAFIEAIERTGLGGRPAQAEPGRAVREPAPGSATVESPQQTVVQMNDGGTLKIPHLPGDVISPGGVVRTQERRTRPPEDDQNT